jgi:D-sedoheptulose 7-phosphate isomerase
MSAFDEYKDNLFHILDCVEVTRENGKISFSEGYDAFISNVKDFRTSQNKLIFIGNGGSAAIASHMAIDYSKAGGINAVALNDPAALTCLANDYGYEQVFSKQLYYQYRDGDILVAISSSGQSENILKAVYYLKPFATIFTFSGFKPDNPLRQMGHLNFYVPSDSYGFVEISHLILLHAILDIYNNEKPK